MTDLVSVLVVGLLVMLALRGSFQRYPGSERSLLWLSLATHLVSGAMLIPLMRGPLKGGDLLTFDLIARALIERLFRAPADTLQVLTGLLLHSREPLPVPDYGLASGSSGSMIALTTFALLMTWSSLPAACVLVAGLSFFGKLCMYEVFRAELDASLHRRVLASTMLVPTTIFWSSGLIKEAFATIGLGLFFKELHRVYRWGASMGAVVPSIIAFCLIATIKAYVLIPFGLAAAASVLLSKAGVRESARKLTSFQRVAIISIGTAAVFGAGIVSSQYDPGSVLDETERQQEVGELMAHAGSHYTVVRERSLAGQIAATPLALVTALFRPFIFEATNVQSAANGLETLVFTVFAARALFRGRRSYGLIRQQPILLFCFVFALIMGVGVGLASTNLGTLSRYRMPMMPFLWVVVTVAAVAGRVRTLSPTVAASDRPKSWVRAPSVGPLP